MERERRRERGREGGKKREVVLFGTCEDGGRIYGVVCGQEIQADAGPRGCGAAAGEVPPLDSSGYLSAGRRGGVAVRRFSLSAVGRRLRQAGHTPLIILPPNTQPLAARFLCARVSVCVYLSA